MNNSTSEKKKDVNCQYLHFGLREDGADAASPTGGRRRMLQKIVSLFPIAPARILYIGCNHSRDDWEDLCPGLQITTATLDDFAEIDKNPPPGQSFDAVVFHESMQGAASLDPLIKKTGALLKPGGLILIADELSADLANVLDVPHASSEFDILLSENNFKITHNESLGRLVMPSPDAGKDRRWPGRRDWYQRGLVDYRLIAAKKDVYTLRTYTADDEERILPMFNEIFHVSRSMEHWNWKFRDDPYGQYKIALALSEAGDLVAHYAAYPVAFYDATEYPKCFLSMQVGDTMTSPSVRNVGIGKTGIMARTVNYYCARFCRQFLPFVYGFNTGKVKKLGERYFNYKYITQVSFWRRDLLQQPLRKAGLIKRLLTGYSVEVVDSVDAEWDDFFDSVCDDYTLLVQRDARYLRWRYLDCPDKVHRLFAVRRRGRLIGWSAFTRAGDRLIWGDALFDVRYPDAVPFLLHGAAACLPEAVSIEGWFSPHPEWWSATLRNNAFEAIEEPDSLTPCFLIFEKESQLEKLEKYLYYTKGDSDLF